ncbi:MAG: hypothetical protein RLZZ312_854 [Bacteroidota bacterium]
MTNNPILEFTQLYFAIKKRSAFIKFIESIYLCGLKFKKMNYAQRVQIYKICLLSKSNVNQKNLQLGYTWKFFLFFNSKYQTKIYANIVTGFSRYCLKVCKNCAPVAPSTVLWSQANVTFMVLPTTICPLRTTGFSTIAPTDNIAEFG